MIRSAETLLMAIYFVMTMATLGFIDSHIVSLQRDPQYQHTRAALDLCNEINETRKK